MRLMETINAITLARRQRDDLETRASEITALFGAGIEATPGADTGAGTMARRAPRTS